MNDAAIVLFGLAAFSAGVIVGRLFPIRPNAALGDEQRVRVGGLELFTWDALQDVDRKRLLAVVLLFLAALVVVALLLPRPAHADPLRLEFGPAKTQHANAGDNIWFDQTYAHDNRLHPWGAILGASGDFDRLQWRRFGVGWRVWAVDFGRTSNRGVWPSDEDYFAHIHSDPVYQGKGSGSAYGLTAAPTVSYRPTEDWQLSAEAGGLAYRATWSEQVQKLDAGGQGTGPWLDISGDWTGAHVGLTPYGGFTARYKSLFAAYRKYRDIHAYNGVFGNSAKQFVVGASIEF